MLYLCLPGFGINITLVSFQSSGVYLSFITHLYIKTKCLIKLSDKYSNNTGFNSSGPAAFLLSNESRASFVSEKLIHLLFASSISCLFNLFLLV